MGGSCAQGLQQQQQAAHTGPRDVIAGPPAMISAEQRYYLAREWQRCSKYALFLMPRPSPSPSASARARRCLPSDSRRRDPPPRMVVWKYVPQVLRLRRARRAARRAAARSCSALGQTRLKTLFMRGCSLRHQRLKFTAHNGNIAPSLLGIGPRRK